MPYMTFSQLKESAKMRLTPVIAKFIGAAAIFYGLTLIVCRLPLLCKFLMESFASQMVFHFFITLFGTAFSDMLRIGFCCLCLKLYCGRPVFTGDIFYAFRDQTKTALSLAIVMSVLKTSLLTPAQFFLQRLVTSQESMDLAVAVFCYTPALILTTMLGLIYSQIYFLMLDFPSYCVKELFQKSRLLMRGHKGRLFYIQVCFLPFLLLGTLTGGIGMLWITPFIYAVQTEFYLDLVTKRHPANAPARYA